MGNLKAVNVTTARVQEYIKDRPKSVKVGTVNRELGLIHRAFQIGYNRDPPLVDGVPFFPNLTEDKPRKGFLKPEHYQELLAELPDELRLLFVVAYHVGLRKGALLWIKWSQVDLAAKTIWMEGERSAPIKSFRASWVEACVRAGVTDLPFHDLRRTAVRNPRRAGFQESIMMKITGHRTRSVFQRYSMAREHEIVAQA